MATQDRPRKTFKRIGIFGGTFDPIHYGHLRIAESAAREMKLDRVIFVPSRRPPHKNVRSLTKAWHRLAMVRRAIQGYPKFSVSAIEVNRSGKSYSIDTIRHFRRLFPKSTKLFYMMGLDAFKGINQWKDVEEIQKQVELIVVNRPGFAKPFKKSGLHFLERPVMDTSSSDVRRQLQAGKPKKGIVPTAVEQYIEEEELYR